MFIQSVNKLIGLFLQPYSFDTWQLPVSARLLKSAGEGVFVATFLIVFKPFGISNWSDPNRIFYLLAFGIITTVASLILRFGIVPAFPKYFNETNWTVWREIMAVLTLVTLIAFGNVLFSLLVFADAFTLKTFVRNFFFVLLVGIFPTTLGVVTNYIRQLKKYQKPVVIKHDLKQHTEVIRMIAENEKDVFEVGQNDLLFVESADNYAVIHYLIDNQPKKELIRSSLTRLESQLESGSIVRCHRSYLVNLDKVREVTGNAQGYKFHLDPTGLVVPVARKYSELVKRIS